LLHRRKPFDKQEFVFTFDTMRMAKSAGVR
jgi:hypothetical protein